MIFELLKQLAQKKMLKTLYEEAKERKEKQVAEKEAAKKGNTATAGVDVQMNP